MNIGKMMNTSPLTVGPEADFTTMLCKLSCLPGRLLYVVDGQGRLLGLVSSRDLLALMVPPYLDSNLARAVADDEAIVRRAFAAHKDETAADIMVTEIVALTPDDQFMTADAVIREKGLNALPVVDKAGRLLGEITRRDALRYLTLSCCDCTCDGVE